MCQFRVHLRRRLGRGDSLVVFLLRPHLLRGIELLFRLVLLLARRHVRLGYGNAQRPSPLAKVGSIGTLYRTGHRVGAGLAAGDPRILRGRCGDTASFGRHAPLVAQLLGTCRGHRDRKLHALVFGYLAVRRHEPDAFLPDHGGRPGYLRARHGDCRFLRGNGDLLEADLPSAILRLRVNGDRHGLVVFRFVCVNALVPLGSCVLRVACYLPPIGDGLIVQFR